MRNQSIRLAPEENRPSDRRATTAAVTEIKVIVNGKQGDQEKGDLLRPQFARESSKSIGSRRGATKVK